MRRNLWAPWRMPYISGATKSKGAKCLFCRKPRSRSTLQHQVLSEGRFGYSLLNLYPYNNGHLLVVPFRHVGRFELLTKEEWLDFFGLTLDAMARLEKALSPHGYNLGINLGRVAGAGVTKHLHLHIVPRWSRDANFMVTLADTKVIPQSLAATHQLLQEAGPPYAKKKRSSC